MHIGPYQLKNNLIVAPMAGVTDRPFRQLCKTMGAGMAVSEMVASNSLLWGSEKTRRRANHDGEVDPISVQIAGADPRMLAEAARYNVDEGAQIIDINMGCPAKKVCNVMAGSALLKDEPLVGRILERGGRRRWTCRSRSRSAPAGTAATATRSGRPDRGSRPASRRSPSTAAPAPAGSRARPSTTPSRRSRPRSASR